VEKNKSDGELTLQELNIFSYVQKKSSFYNLIKNEQHVKKILDVPNRLSNLLGKVRKGRNAEKIEKIRREISRNLEEMLQGLETLSQYASFEAPPRGVPLLLETLSEIANQLQETQGKTIPEVVRKIERFIPELEKRVKVLEDASCLEYIVKLTRDLPLEKCREHLQFLRKIYSQKYASKILYVRLRERGVFGASQKFGKYLFEVGLEIDPYMNVPIIPASTIKGALRKAYETLQPKRGWPLPEKIFGSSRSPEGGGTIGAFIFTDGYPVKAGRGGYVLYPDVITPHYPADLMGELDHEPKPISHLSIAPETCFGFVVAYKREEITDEILRETIKLAIDMGIGARTSAGYGVFELAEGEK
jgi:CRISPR/Cas system CMR subunit Cmr6 (Cas7 group RAMP superfamily)